MVTPTCSRCGKVIPSEDVNVANDVAYCRACNISYPLSALTLGTEVDANIDFTHPPAGAWYTSSGMGPVIGATHRSVGTAIGALAISLFWNGIVSVFVLVAISGTLRNLGITPPHWFPAPIMNDSPMSVGMTIFLWIFLTPFILIGLVMIGAFLSSIGGRTEVRITNAEGVVFTGVGGLGYRRRFDSSAVKDVRVEDKQWRDSDGDRQRKTCILIETREGKQIKLGTMLTPERRKFLAGALRKVLWG
ncbi:MAG: hypothetical protein NT154_32755 [Verrucomicrobia bacterium]|nr:hypothetical protein [Verrucomicrobiota bacterium]